MAARTRDLEESDAQLVAAATERERAKAQLRQLQQLDAVGRLTGGVAYDFNDLLTVVLGNLAMARRRLDDGDDGRLLRAIDSAAAGAERAAELTWRLLAFSRQQPLAPEPVEVNRLVAGMSELLRRTLGEDIQIETVLAGGSARPGRSEPARERDPEPCGQCARRHAGRRPADDRDRQCPSRRGLCRGPRGGPPGPVPVCDAFRLRHRLRHAPGRGEGLPTLLHHQAGRQGHGARAEPSLWLRRQSGGHAAIYSEPEQGTTIRHYLPRLREAAAEARAVLRNILSTPIAPAVPTGRSETVLLVEDDPMVCDFATVSLEEAGYRVLAAEDGPTALALLDAHPEIVLLFTDVVLTGR